MPPPRLPAAARLVILGLFLACLVARQAAAEQITVFAAASTADALSDAALAFEAAAQERGEAVTVRTVFAASSTLAKQITQGAPADLFLSASTAWMDYLDSREAIEPASRVDLLSNRLALIVPANSDLRPALDDGRSLLAAVGGGRLAMGDPAHVPAGVYGQAALTSLGIWQDLADRTARAASVRAALALVERGEAVAGIVYRSDAQGRKTVRLVGLFPADSHPAIAYPLAVVRGRGSPATLAFARFLQGETAQATFRAHGFATPTGGG